ncbi:MAG: SAM-dependent chlorinase/fluorinase [candidate division KSB1 bacterium]|nr:SAM-dependent chlorinase/fluorinase [candidate division KSB1 bacterium]MDZ7318560.1 SAM-dependent chlorinase/fluorinase [candidate division KSB1 bacterium]MDZ7342548.1 SAM-dependent chlorinase/fluorinase [candidate division KSB1 bacterium]
MRPCGIITLLTDFGMADGFVGTMKGVILSIYPQAHIVDLTHQIPPQDISAAAFVLHCSHRYFPAGTIHVAVVDPGVGSSRRLIAVASEKYLFLAPDNQILAYIFHESETLKVIEVLNNQFFLPNVSRTFHGRDIFAAVAAHLAAGVPIKRLGPEIHDYDRGKIDQPRKTENGIQGKIIHIDQFGNLISNIPESWIKGGISAIRFGQMVLNRISDAYADVGSGEPLAIFGSSGYLEIAIRDGNASRVFGAGRGAEIRIDFETLS